MSVKGPYAFEYARIAVPDVAASAAWYEKYVGLEPCGKTDGHTYLRAGLPHHALDLVEDRTLPAAEVRAFGFSVESEAVLEALKERVEDSGAPVKELDEAQKSWCAGGFATADPAGNALEFFTDYQEWAERPYRAYTPDYIVHPFIGTPKYDETLTFYLDVLGFRPSDYIANVTAFLRSENRLHHSFAIRRAKEKEVAHICFAMGSLDQVMRGRALAVYDKVKIAADMANHSASKSIAFYILDEKHGPRIELCNGHRRLTEEEHEHEKPRRMSVDPRNIDVWRAAADDWHDL
ncbi:MAG TPA: VOC family protein [Candidatus Limnocylindria bacterium]|nr:VOC family protein [Candidatus Limnocylindria bacterium]